MKTRTTLPFQILMELGWRLTRASFYISNMVCCKYFDMLGFHVGLQEVSKGTLEVCGNQTQRDSRGRVCLLRQLSRLGGGPCGLHTLEHKLSLRR